MMASEYYKHEAELSVGDIEEVKEEVPEIKPFSNHGNEQNASGNQFDALLILKEELVEEDPTETKPLSEYGVFTDCLDKNEDIFYDPDSGVFEVMQKNGKNPKESKFSPTHSFENTECLAGDSTKPKVNHNNGVMLKNEDGDHSKCTEDSSTNVELKTEMIKIEYDIDIHEDVKPYLFDKKSIGKNENESYLNFDTGISIETEIGPNFCHEFSTDSETWSQQNIEEDGTAVKRANDSGKLPDSEYSPFESKKGHLAGHERTHTKEKPFQCIVCPESFEHKSELLNHNVIHTGKRPFQCKICSVFFSLKNNFIKHEKIHTRVKKSFTQKATLSRHEPIHTEKKTFQCKFCPESFAYISKFLRHERKHTGEKPFQCKICAKSFKNKSDLTRHEMIHTGEKPFQCKICSKSFSQKTNLMVHERIHTGEKPFHCKVCLKSFSKRRALLHHEENHARKKPV